MSILSPETFSQLICDPEDQAHLRKARSRPYVERRVRRAEFSAPDEGWYILDEKRARDISLAKDKPDSQIFEDGVWCLLSKMGYHYLSRDRNCRIKYESDDQASQQVDILAVDDDCALIVECKTVEGGSPKAVNLKTDIEALGGKKAGLHRELRYLFGKPDLKIVYVLATKNIIMKEADLARITALGIRHLSDADVEYYNDLLEHLGAASRYQLEADLFHGQDVGGIENRVYAVKGSMGGHDYYSFAIEPERLLKLGYVLHRSKSIKLLPTYQRLIKKPRLKSVRKFIELGGYFPNSLIVSIDDEQGKVKFDPMPSPINGASTRAGVLHLPKCFRSIYVVDGQHRLYGYSGTSYSKSNTVPVVAFKDLSREDQLRLFMEINENQKAVSKNLKHTLDADLKWDSPNLADRADGVKKQLIQELGENISSPLFNRVLVGEDQRTDIKVITLEALLRGINLTSFVGKFTKNSVREQGSLNTGDSSRTVDLIRKVTSGFFRILMEEMPDEWARLPRDGALLTINDGVTALIGLLGDIIDHCIHRVEIRPLTDSPDKIISVVQEYTPGLIAYFRNLKESDREELRQKYGSGAPTRLRRIFQLAVQGARDDFQPSGLAEYWRDQSKIYNVETYSRVADIELGLREEVKEALISAYGPLWLKKGLPEKLYTHLITEAGKKNRTIENPEDEKTPWDCMNLIHLREIASHGNHWSTLFQKRLTIPGEEGRKKDDKTNWIVKLNTIRNNADHEYSISKADADYVAALHDWLILDDSDAIVRQSGAQPQE